VPGVTSVDRRQVLAFRAQAQGLGRTGRKATALDALDLGIQDSPAGSAALALAARLIPADPSTDDLTMVWSTRGAPHLHRTAELKALARALVPRSDDDAAARLAGFGANLKKKGGSGLEAIAATAEAVREVTKGELTKGELSAGVTERIPKEFSEACRSCGTTHVSDQLLRLAAFPGGARLVPDTSPQAFRPLPRWPKITADPKGARKLVLAYLRLHGPATPKEAAGFLGTTTTEAKALWPDDLAEVTVAGRKAWIPPAQLADLQAAEAPEGVRFLPHSDPLLQARDRDLLVPDKARQKSIWTVLGGPGAVFAEGDVVGSWRAKVKGKKGLELTVTPFGRLSRAVRTALDDEAERVAQVRRRDEVTVRVD
jgi:DNA glycosylase AlkZ-like